MSKGDASISTHFVEEVAFDTDLYNAAIEAENLSAIDDILSKMTDRNRPSFINGVNISFAPPQAKLATRETQEYDVTITATKGNQLKTKVFTETISPLSTTEANQELLDSLIQDITSRDIDINDFKKKGIKVTFEPEYPVSKETTDFLPVTVTLSKGIATAEKSFGEIVPAANVYVAFSGGGWHSHTTLAGWLMGAMDAMDSEEADSGTLENLTTNVDALSCNSGGCWFTTQLAFSETFSSKLETQTNEQYFSLDGYLGQTRKIFEDELDHLVTKPEYVTMAHYTTHWSDFLEKSVFKPFDMNSELANVTLDSDPDSTRLSWAEYTPLIYSTALGTNTFVTSDDGWWDYKTYYQAGFETDWFDEGKHYTYTPAAFTSLGDSDHIKSPVFLVGDIKLRYAYDNSAYPWVESTNIIPADHPSGGIRVMGAAASSSAAAGLLANINYQTSESAIGFEVTENGFEQYYDDGAMDEDYNDTAQKRRVRFADGGYVDNTSAAFMMKHLQVNDLDSAFKIVLFMNSSTSATSSILVNELNIPQSAAILFGHGFNEPVSDNGTIPFIDKTIPFTDKKVDIVSVPSADIFTEASWKSGKEYWKHADNGVSLRYVKFDVTTKDNPRFGIEAGSTGELHLFIGVMDASNAMPGDYTSQSSIDGILDTYETMLTETRKGVTEEGGWKYLKEALNL